MFERFTDRARRVVVLAQEEARLLNHNHIGTEHILLGLVHEGEGVAYVALTELGISLDAVRAQVEAEIGQGSEAPSGHIPFTPRAKKVLELSLREALQLGHNYIGTEHILLGLIREGEGVAARALVGLGADLDRVRQQVVQVLSGYAGVGQAEQVAAGPSRVRQEAVTAMVAGGPGAFQLQPVELVRVVPLAREVFDGLGVRLVLISLEIWSGWMDLRYVLLPQDQPGAQHLVDFEWQVSDDAGTDYELMGMATGGGRVLHIFQLGFRPAPPDGIRTLTLKVSGGEEPTRPLVAVEIDLVAGP
jgi:Clp amino terminal domain, pathogenicity island component